MLLYESDSAEALESAAADFIPHLKISQALTVCEAVLSGMLAAGFGIDTVSVYLGIAQAEILEHVGRLGLSIPPPKVLRKAGKNAWTTKDIQHLIGLWLAGVDVASIAASVGRKRGSVYYKKRRLGLPARDRRGLHALPIEECQKTELPWKLGLFKGHVPPAVECEPAVPLVVECGPPVPDEIQVVPEETPSPVVDEPEGVSCDQPASRSVIVCTPGRVAKVKKPVEPKLGPHRRVWSEARDNRLIDLAFANLQPVFIAKVISDEFKCETSHTAAASRISRLEIKRDKKALLAECDLADVPRRAEETRRALNAERRVCKKLNRAFFIYDRQGRHRLYCREYTHGKKFSAARSDDSAMAAYC
jgi:hypothetical protein